MAKNYNPYNDVNSIYNLKEQWAAANAAGDDAKKNEAAQKARQYYINLRNGGYGDVADKLQKEDNNLARITRDYYTKTGRTATRPYLRSLGKSKGMSEEQVDALIGYDNATGEITFGGKNIGKPDTVTTDGTSYWSDTSVLDNAFNDYVSRSGTTTPTGVDNDAYNRFIQGYADKNDRGFNELFKDSADVQGKYDEIYKYANSDITDSAEYKSAFKNIMPEYKIAAMQGAYNEAADGASQNAGNVDSFAAANAARQQAALTAKGQALAHQMGIDAYNARVNGVMNILSGLGYFVNDKHRLAQEYRDSDLKGAQTVFDNEQTAKMNDHAINADIASITGKVPDAWSGEGNPYLNRDGSLKEQYKNINFLDLIESAEKNGNTELASVLREARGAKGMTYPDEFGKFLSDGNWDIPGQKQTEEARQFTEAQANAMKLAEAEHEQNKYNTDVDAALTREGYASNESINAANNKNTIDQMKLTAELQGTENDDYAAYNVLLSMYPADETRKRAFIEEFIKPIYEGKESITPEGLKQLIMVNSEKYNIDVDDAKKICQAFDVSTDWLNQFRDRTDDDGITAEGRAGRHGGMVGK